MKRLLIPFLAALPLLGQTPTPTVTPTITPTPTITRTPTRTPTIMLPQKYSLATQVRPGFPAGNLGAEATTNLPGDTYYAKDARSFDRVAPNTTATRKFWMQVSSAKPLWVTLQAGDIPALSYVTSVATTAPITGGTITGSGTIGISDCSATARGAVPDPTGAGAGTFLDKTCNWSQPSGSFTSPLTTKGDLHTYSTGDTRLAVGANGTVPMADSGATPGLSYQYPGVGTLRTLKETTFAGITPAGYADASTTTIDGSDYTASVPSGGAAIDIVASGLRLRMGSTPSFSIMTISPGATGDFLSILGEARFRRGHWALWSHMASYDYTNTSGVIRGVTGEVTMSGWGVSLANRNRNLDGAPNSTTGGLAMFYTWGSLQDPSSYPGVTSADVMCAYFRAPDIVDVYYGTWSSGWPTMESMTFLGTIRMSPQGFVGNVNPIATSVAIRFYIGGSSSTTGTYEIIIDRWRLTAWE
ncbi:MAG: hypothetical protein PHS14_14465 [Elusimicrobia bacterium]|nr:hypothetical protein [Elusimicrobiota bacterium]